LRISAARSGYNWAAFDNQRVADKFVLDRLKLNSYGFSGVIANLSVSNVSS